MVAHLFSALRSRVCLAGLNRPWKCSFDLLSSRVRAIGNLPSEAQARLFGDYLLASGIKNEQEADSDGTWVVWVADDDQLAQAGELLTRFKAAPESPEFARRAADADQIRREEKKSEARWRRRVHGRKQIVPGTTVFRPGPLTFTLVCLCVMIAVRSRLGDNVDAIRSLFISEYMPNGTNWFSEVKAGEVWRVFTPMLIHFGFPHLLFNMLWLFRLGSMIETVHGSGRLALLVLAIAGLSNIAQYVIDDPGFGGMSGVNYGLFGYVWIRGKFDPSSGFFVTPQDKLLMLGWFALCFTGWVGPIANAAHTGGLVIGVAWGWISAMWALRNR